MNCNASIHQIFYSTETAQMLDPGFIPMDNRSNERPDWREYWPIRRFFAKASLEANRFFGFLAPRFTEKTGLSSFNVYELVEGIPASVQVISLSPYSDHASSYWNVFEQGETYHPGFLSLSDQVASSVGLSVPPSSIMNTTRDAIFCNYFLAKPAFWIRWCKIAEAVFAFAESSQSELANKLREDTCYDGKRVPTKNFFIERIVSYLLATEKQWTVASLEPFTLPNATKNERSAFVMLDSLKQSYRDTGNALYRDTYFEIRARAGYQSVLAR
jgi:hypothetical protein